MLTFILGAAYTLGGAATVGLMYYRATIKGYSVWMELGPLPVFAAVAWPVALPIMGAVVLAKNAGERHLQRERARRLEEAELTEALKQLEAGT